MKKLNQILSTLNLRLFDGDGSQDASGADDSAEQVVYGIQENESVENEPVKEDEPAEEAVRDFDKEFEELIKGDFKKQYDDRVHKNIAGKTAQINKLKSQVEEYSPLIKVLSMKYGVQDGNINSLVQAIESDNASYEQEAYQKNMTVEQLKHLKQIEAENDEFKRQTAEANNKALAAKQVDQWIAQGKEFSAVNPGFDLNEEVNNPKTGQRFARLLQAGLSVQEAFNSIHMNEILNSAKQISEKEVIDRVKSRNARPDELTNGLTSNVRIKNDPNSFTDKDFEEIRKQVELGKRIIF